MSAGSGACLNPALGMSQTIYYAGVNHNTYHDIDPHPADCIWVYMLAPFAGAIFAALFVKFHLKNETVQQFE
jgi:glycerol uptake facilitator-like aquaporin